MGLPRIDAYDLPRSDELPAPRVDWRLDPARAALLVHDMQRYFVAPFPVGASPIAPAVGNVAALADGCRHAGVPVFYTVQRGGQDPRDRGLQRDVWGPGMGVGDEHEGVTPELEPEAGDLVLPKSRYSAFQRTTLEPMLRARGRDQLVVTGIYAHIGCLLSAADAFMRDIQPFFVADAVADFSRQKHDMAVAYVGGHCGVVTTTDTLLEVLRER